MGLANNPKLQWEIMTPFRKLLGCRFDFIDTVPNWRNDNNKKVDSHVRVATARLMLPAAAAGPIMEDLTPLS